MDYFLDQKLTDEEKKKGYISYGTLSKTMNMIICNNIEYFIFSHEINIDIYNGNEYTEDGDPIEIFQYFIIDEKGANILKEYTNELVYFIDELYVYIWAIRHYGTSWNLVSTDIKIGDFEK